MDSGSVAHRRERPGAANVNPVVDPLSIQVSMFKLRRDPIPRMSTTGARSDNQIWVHRVGRD